jgi:hypothetical protein
VTSTVTSTVWEQYLSIAASISVILSAVAAIAAAWFIAVQIAHMKRVGEVDAFLRVLDAGNRDPVSSCSAWVKYEMPAELTYEEARNDRATWDKIGHVEHHFETIAILVDRGYISENLIYDQMGPWIAGTWAKLEHLIVAHRSAKRAPDYAENFEMLATRYDKWAEAHPPKLEKRARAGKQAIKDYYKQPVARKRNNSRP